jgi:hypothetical protein
MDPHKLLIWNKPETWERPICNIIVSIIGQETANSILRKPPEELYSDDSSWLDPSCAFSTDAYMLTGRGIRETFQYIRAYHACKPFNIQRYFSRGLLPFSIEEFAEDSAERFSASGISYAHIKTILSDHPNVRSEIGHLWFNLSDRVFLQAAGHYLIYGGELLLSFCRELAGVSNGLWSLDYLKKVGIPTVFICNVPLEHFSEGTLKELSGDLLCRLFNRKLGRKCNRSFDDFGFTIKYPVNRDLIVGHYHPKEIKDLYSGWHIWRPRRTTCSFCGKDTMSGCDGLLPK